PWPACPSPIPTACDLSGFPSAMPPASTMGRARLTRLIAKASSGHLGEERAQAWLDAAHFALELYGDHPALAFDDRAAEVVTEVRLLHATEAELPAHESAREQAYRQVDPDQLARSLPGVAAVGGPALAALIA